MNACFLPGKSCVRRDAMEERAFALSRYSPPSIKKPRPPLLFPSLPLPLPTAPHRPLYRINLARKTTTARSKQRHEEAGGIHQQQGQPASQDARGEARRRGSCKGGGHRREAARDESARRARGRHGEYCFGLSLAERFEKREDVSERENGESDEQKTPKKQKKLTKQGRDHTLFALVPGRVSFEWDHRAKRRSVRIVEDGS